MRGALTRRVLDMLSKMAKANGDDYKTVWAEFGQVLKEGVIEDHANKDKLSKLLRFSTTQERCRTQDQSLADYVGSKRRGAGQDLLHPGRQSRYGVGKPASGAFRQAGSGGAVVDRQD